jgi:hypothetical protein
MQTGELIDKQGASPRKRRKKVLGAGTPEEGGPPAKRLKHDNAPNGSMPVRIADTVDVSSGRCWTCMDRLSVMTVTLCLGHVFWLATV